MAYYEIFFGSGFYWMERYVIKTDYPTTDYGALTDVLWRCKDVTRIY